MLKISVTLLKVVEDKVTLEISLTEDHEYAQKFMRTIEIGGGFDLSISIPELKPTETIPPNPSVN